MFEYICSGGFFAKELPVSLANEGRKMLQALLDEFKLNKQIQIVLLLDPRFTDLDLPVGCEVIWADDTNFWLNFDVQMARCDAVLPIAPEQDGLLALIASRVKATPKQLWLSDPDAVRLCTDKIQTMHLLAQNGLPVVETKWFNDPTILCQGTWVIKPNDGMGCLGSVITQNIDDCELQNTANLIVQPYIVGDHLSLSAVFIHGTGHLLTCNRQQISQEQGKFSLLGCTVNIEHPFSHAFGDMINKIAAALPGLWGYIGIDLIVSPELGPLILEINPRLTTSYVGVYQATGIRPHLQLYNHLNGQYSDFTCKWNESIEVCL